VTDYLEADNRQPLVSQKQAVYTQERRQYWDDFAASLARWQRVRGYYQRRLAEIYRFLIPPGMRVMELGCGSGDLLAAVQPAHGVGVDFSAAILDRAKQRHPHLDFRLADAHLVELGEQFD
jgi:ubiquinone/menaquinone biosynthesis C-methylase UbiE